MREMILETTVQVSYEAEEATLHKQWEEEMNVAGQGSSS